MEETLRVLVTLGFGLLLVMLRLDAERFGVAEYLGEASGGGVAIVSRRLSWYILGFALVAAVALIHPDPESQLRLESGDPDQALLAGLGFAALGVAQAAAVALARYRRLRLPEVRSYPWGLVNSAATALIDEAAFRGIILGFLLAAGLDDSVAIVLQALLYALVTRTGAPGRDLYLLALDLGIGLVGGWLTVETGGIGAAVLGHAVTRFAVFAFIGDGDARPERAAIPGSLEESGSASSAWPTIGVQGSNGRDR